MGICGKIPNKDATFLASQKDLFNIVQMFINNEDLKKLLFYQVKDALKKPELTQEETLGLLHKNIRVVPQLPVDEEVESYVIISFNNFFPNPKNPQFRDNTITFDVLCHTDTWVMENYGLRPYLIMGQIDGMMNGAKLNGIGRVEYLGASQMILSDDMSGFTIMYKVINDF